MVAPTLSTTSCDVMTPVFRAVSTAIPPPPALVFSGSFPNYNTISSVITPDFSGQRYLPRVLPQRSSPHSDLYWRRNTTPSFHSFSRKPIQTRQLQGCGEEMRADKRRRHHKTACPMRYLPCPLGCPKKVRYDRQQAAQSDGWFSRSALVCRVYSSRLGVGTKNTMAKKGTWAPEMKQPAWPHCGVELVLVRAHRG